MLSPFRRRSSPQPIASTCSGDVSPVAGDPPERHEGLAPDTPVGTPAGGAPTADAPASEPDGDGAPATETTASEAPASEPDGDGAPAPETVAPEPPSAGSPSVAAPRPSAEPTDPAADPAAAEMKALLTSVLDTLGAAHHRPFSRP
jgi:preprotein translocase subunit SecG